MLCISKGLYILVFEVDRDVCTAVGSLGYVCFSRGIYGYVGSAKGIGGIESRVKHHLDKYKKKCRWHIDYLTIRDEVKILYIVFSETMDLNEEDIVNEILRENCWGIAIRGFGSTDKKTPSHLFKCRCDYSACIDRLKHVFIGIGLEPHVNVFM